jgi:drug/metabolite transporter (DMT)-like permease
VLLVWCVYQGLSYTAAHYTTATNMGIVNAFVPFLPFLFLFILKDKPNRFAILGSLLSFAGLIYVMSQGHFSSLFAKGTLGRCCDGDWVDSMHFMGCFSKNGNQLPLMTSLYVQIAFALLYHLPFLFG